MGTIFAMRQCARGTVFFTPDDSTERLFVLKSGQVVLYRLTPSGKRLITRRIGPGMIFGEMGLLGQTMQGCFAESQEDSLVCSATRDDVRSLLQQRPEVALRMLEAMGSRLKLLEERLEQAAFSPVKVRLAELLLANADPGSHVVQGYTQEEIGDLIGALRQTVTENLGALQAHGLVEVKHRSVRITDRKGLQRLALTED